LDGTGLRIGEALGLRHEDVDTRRRLEAVQPRENVNWAWAKTWSREVPADTELFRLYRFPDSDRVAYLRDLLLV